jgi:hypothetical protein
MCGHHCRCSCTLTGSSRGLSNCSVCQSSHSIVSNSVCTMSMGFVETVMSFLILCLYVWTRCWGGLYWHHLCESDRQVVQPAVTVPMPGATLAAPSFGMRGSYNDYLSMPAGNMTSAYGRGYTPTGTFRYDSRVGAGGSNRHYWGLLSLQDGCTSCKLRMQYSYGGCRRVDNMG